MPAPAAVFRLELDSVGALIKAYAAFVADGYLSFPPTGLPPGAEVAIVLDTRDVGVFEGTGKVVQAPAKDETRASLVAARRLRNFIHERAIELRQGRLTGAAEGRRKHARYDTYLPVRSVRGDSFGAAHVTNVSRGGVFIATDAPPGLAAKVSVEMTFPRGPVQVDLRVNRVVIGSDATPGFGAVFEDEKAAFATAIEALLADYRARAPRVLMVESDAALRSALAGELEASGVNVQEAADARDGLAKLRQRLLELDLLVVDVMMPQLAGPELLQRLRAMDLPVVVLARGPVDARSPLRTGGMVADAVSRTEPIATLASRIHKVLQRSS